MTVFNRRPRQQTEGYPLGVILGRSMTKGDVGIEIEVEGSRLPKNSDDLAPFWTYHKDGSLRGKDNAEYVLARPLIFDDVPQAISALWTLFLKSKSVLDDSNRTSVHVHLNFQTFHMNRLTAFCALYLCFEEVLTEWCGEHRVGNLFCLRGKDAPGLVRKLKRFITADGDYELSEGLHYSGLNVHALRKFGSVEVRTLRGVADPDVILDWVTILRRIYDLSDVYKDPRDICSLFSQQGPAAFFETVLGDKAMTIRNGIEFNEERIADSMYEGIRLAQELCYCRDWDLFKATPVTQDPFGRKKSAKSAQTSAFSDVAMSGWTTAPAPSGPGFNQIFQASPSSLSQIQPTLTDDELAELYPPESDWNEDD